MVWLQRPKFHKQTVPVFLYMCLFCLSVTSVSLSLCLSVFISVCSFNFFFFTFRYGLVTETQVSQTDIVTLEAKWNISVLRIRHSTQFQGGLTLTNPNETTLILNLVCDQVWQLRKVTKKERKTIKTLQTSRISKTCKRNWTSRLVRQVIQREQIQPLK